MHPDWNDVERLIQRVGRLERRLAKLEPAKPKTKPTTGPQTAVVTASIGASTFAVTGSITGDVMTVAAVASGTIVLGSAVTGTDVLIGTQVDSQIAPLLANEALGGVGTGERGDRVILDDPHNVKEIESETVRTETVRWFRESMSDRLNSISRRAPAETAPMR